jgi:outer membrane protein assembly factor BamB
VVYRIFVLWVLLAVSSTQAEDWPQWRGPYFNGSTSEKGLPAEWSTTDNIAWNVTLPGAAASTPIVWEQRVFLSGVDSGRDMLQAMCFDRVSGTLLWSHDVAKGIRQDSRSNKASSSPATDGRQVVFFYGSGDLACFDLDGGRRWTRNIQQDYGPLAFFWTFGGSPLLYEGRLYLQVLQRNAPVDGRDVKGNESYLLALDPRTGKTLWRHVRPSQAAAESQESHTTPVPMLHAGRRQLLIAGGDALSGHDPATGQELWRWGGWNPSRAPNWPLIASPVAGDGIALVCVPKGQPVYGITTQGNGALDAHGVLWTSRGVREVTSEVPTPAYYDGDFFVLSDSRNCLSRVAASTGRTVWTVRTPGTAKYEASPLAADGKIYLINFNGEVAVLNATSGEVLRVIPMDQPGEGEMVRASMIAAHGQLFIRTASRLYCVGKGR